MVFVPPKSKCGVSRYPASFPQLLLLAWCPQYRGTIVSATTQAKYLSGLRLKFALPVLSAFMARVALWHVRDVGAAFVVH
jgi:hypothetical protein